MEHPVFSEATEWHDVNRPKQKTERRCSHGRQITVRFLASETRTDLPPKSTVGDKALRVSPSRCVMDVNNHDEVMTDRLSSCREKTVLLH